MLLLCSLEPDVRYLSSAAPLFLLAAGIAAAADISVMGLTAGRAVVSIDGSKPHSMAVGQVAPEGVKLISATTESATFEVGGKRQTLSMGQSISVAESTVSAQRATL